MAAMNDDPDFITSAGTRASPAGLDVKLTATAAGGCGDDERAHLSECLDVSPSVCRSQTPCWISLIRLTGAATPRHGVALLCHCHALCRQALPTWRSRIPIHVRCSASDFSSNEIDCANERFNVSPLHFSF